MLIKEASADEIEIVRSVMYEAFKEYIGVLHPPSGALSETVEGIKRKVEGRGGSLLVWEDNEPIGSALYYFEETDMYIGRVSVLPACRGKGIGKGMLAYLENLARNKRCGRLKIEVRSSLPDNYNYYRKLGFVSVEEREYPDKSDRWHIMIKSLE